MPNHHSSTPKDNLTHHHGNEDHQTQSQMLKDLEESGTCAELQNDTRTLLYNSGWHDAMKQLAIQSIQERGGLTNATLDDVAAVLLNEGRVCVPESVKNLVHQRVLEFVEKGQRL